MDLVFATNNTHKIAEVRSILPKHIQLKSLQDIGCLQALPETHFTIEENSLEKADYVFNTYAIDCFSEDSGLEVHALHGQPGVDSAHYSGSRDAGENMALLLENLKNISNRSAQFKTVFTLKTQNFTKQFTGIVTGKITYKPVGFEGFGYDPIFVPDGYTQTFAEMKAEQKTLLSHRSKAFILMTTFIDRYFIL